MSKKRTQDAIKKYFGASAAHYESQIVPAFRQFAAGVIQTAHPQGQEITLDVGTGTGILARLIAPHVREVIGIDFAPEMIAAAQEVATPTNVRYEEADAHALPYGDHTFELIVSSFGLNATEPRRVFRELHRVLKPGGRLVFHEWSVQHSMDSRLIDTLAKFMLPDEDISEELFQMREFTRTVRPWDNILQTTEDFEEVISEAGFSSVQVWEDAPVMVTLSVQDFMAYKLGWANRQAELAAMDSSLLGDCLDTIRWLVQDFSDSEGNVHYDPLLFRVVAEK